MVNNRKCPKMTYTTQLNYNEYNMRSITTKLLSSQKQRNTSQKQTSGLLCKTDNSTIKLQPSEREKKANKPNMSLLQFIKRN